MELVVKFSKIGEFVWKWVKSCEMCENICELVKICGEIGVKMGEKVVEKCEKMLKNVNKNVKIRKKKGELT